MNLLILLLLSLGTFRLTVLLSQEDGPFDIFKRFRTLIGIKQKEVEYQDDYGTTMTVYEKHIQNSFAKLIDCQHCLSGWLSLIIVLIFEPSTSILNWLAVWGLVYILIEKVK